MRPIYRKKDERIRSHVVICLLEENRSHETEIKNERKPFQNQGLARFSKWENAFHGTAPEAPRLRRMAV